MRTTLSPPATAACYESQFEKLSLQKSVASALSSFSKPSDGGGDKVVAGESLLMLAENVLVEALTMA
jgi:hypothetical protein